MPSQIGRLLVATGMPSQIGRLLVATGMPSQIFTETVQAWCTFECCGSHSQTVVWQLYICGRSYHVSVCGFYTPGYVPHTCVGSKLLYVPHTCVGSTLLYVPHTCVGSTLLYVPRICVGSTLLYVPHTCVGSTLLYVPHTCVGFTLLYVPLTCVVLHVSTFHMFVSPYTCLYSTYPRTFCISVRAHVLSTHTFRIFVRYVYTCLYVLHTSMLRTHTATFHVCLFVRHTRFI
jgi:hypothetical protein